jgi:DNA-binding CsgD family transcriptional regulator
MAAYLRETVDVTSRIGRSHQNYLDLGGNLCAETGRWAEAVTLWAAYAAERKSVPGHVAAEDIRRKREYLRQSETALDPAQLRAAQERGTRMTLAVATEFVALLTAPAPASPVPAKPGSPDGGELTPRERELVTLVAQGRTNTEIAGELFISVRTVASHLDRIRAKTGARRRAVLTRLALRKSLV